VIQVVQTFPYWFKIGVERRKIWYLIERFEYIHLTMYKVLVVAAAVVVVVIVMFV
jgi:hypothetical protein